MSSEATLRWLPLFYGQAVEVTVRDFADIEHIRNSAHGWACKVGLRLSITVDGSTVTVRRVAARFTPRSRSRP